MNELTLVPAGAGAGKTHRIKTELTEWVKSGKVRPDRILAVTFTEAAAGELKQRIRTSLLDAGLLDAALAVDRAYISTIHSLGLRFLTEHAFANGSSPMPRLLSDPERDLLLRPEIARSEALQPISADLQRYGYTSNFVSGASAEDAFRNQVFSTINHLRNLGERGTDPALATLAVATIRKTYGKTVGNVKALGDELHAAVSALLKQFPASIAPLATSRTAGKKFDENFRSLRAASVRPELDRNWALWQKLRGLRLSKRGAPTPDGYDDLASAVITAADALPRHPGPLADAILHTNALIRGSQSILKNYAARKLDMGVIDYADMIIDAERVLRTDDGVASAILAEVDCVIIDEFQDTNPIQFAFLWRLAARAPRTLIVGDVKQAIMGFQGADSRLMESLVVRHAAHVDPLDRNWRSDPRIMSFINQLGPKLFGPGFLKLAPTQALGTELALEILSLETAGGGKHKLAKPTQYVAARVFNLLENEEAWVVDRNSGKNRALLPRDVAVLCPTHAIAAAHAAELRRLGLPVHLSADGWHGSTVVQVALNALALACDPTDRHAALCFAVQGPPAINLESALNKLADHTLAHDPAFGAFSELQRLSQTLTVPALLDATIDAMRLRDWADRQADARQARADLLRLVAEAQTFIDTHRDMLGAAGFFGSNAKVFIGWLNYRTSEREFDHRPNPGTDVRGSVEVVTWHASKGREWPVVCVAGLENTFDPRSFTLTTQFESFEKPDAVLDAAKVDFYPGLDAPEQDHKFFSQLMPEAQANARKLLYVALTRPRQKLIIAWPGYHLTKEPDSETDLNSFAKLLHWECGLAPGNSGWRIANTEFAARKIHCDGTHPPEFDEAEERDLPDTGYSYGLGAILPEVARDPGASWIIRPSAGQSDAVSVIGNLNTVDLGSAIVTQRGSFDDAALRGTALHQAIRVMMQRPDFRQRLATHTGLDEAAINAVAAQATALAQFLSDSGYHAIHHEVPLMATNEAGSSYNAIIDCLAESADGFAIIDHKSDAPDDLNARFSHHWPQLSAYVDVLKLVRPDKPVRLVAINWLSKGKMTVRTI